jgi:hypothetical protein
VKAACQQRLRGLLRDLISAGLLITYEVRPGVTLRNLAKIQLYA